MSRRAKSQSIGGDPMWYKDAIVYEVHVRAFLDSNADGIGDFAGLTQKLDYFQELGVTAIWLLPFYPSPLKDDGYDIADYCTVNPIYGTLRDFKEFLDGAHERQLRVITELVINHTSDQHSWFQRARRSPPGSIHRDFYVWSDNAEKFKEARVIFRDFEPSNWSWDRVANAYYWHRFYSHQPDLNFDNPAVHKELFRILDFWMDMGVDGLRLDAIPYLYEREGTSCENLPETHEFLKTLRRHVDEEYGDRMLLAEANQWPEDSAAYLGSGKGDECHMAFHFPLMPRIFMSVRMEDRLPITDILEQTPPIPETSQWAVFLRNHDELTLEMVTDEERDYMYRVYASEAKARINLGIRRRLAPLLGNDRKRIELLNLLLVSCPGTPFLYYGDEIGLGDNIYLGDRNGVRTPMQWSSDKNAGFFRASPHALYFPIILDPEYHYEAVNVEAQQTNPHSLWWWMKRVLALRKRFKAFGRGSIHFLAPDNRKILAFIRRYEEETILVVANLSRFVQPVHLDLSEFKQRIPKELFGRTAFPTITEHPYFLTLHPHAAFWFSLEYAAGHAEVKPVESELLFKSADWEEVWREQEWVNLEQILLGWLVRRRWFAAKGRDVRAVQVTDAVEVPVGESTDHVLLLRVEYTEGDPQEYVLPVGLAQGAELEEWQQHRANHVIARVRFAQSDQQWVLFDASADPAFCRQVLHGIARRRTFSGYEGEIRASHGPHFRGAEAANGIPSLEVRVGKAEQSNSSAVFGDKYFLKIFRKIEPGINPDIEIGRFLTNKQFPNIPACHGALEYRRKNGETLSLGILTQFFPEARDAWTHSLESLSRYFERVTTSTPGTLPEPRENVDVLTLASRELPELVIGLVGTYAEAARLLGQRTGELHLALASDSEDPQFAPEPFTPFYQRSIYQSMRNLVVQNFGALRRSLGRLPEGSRVLAEKVIPLEGELLKRFRAIYQGALQVKRIRCHGDYHLGQVLYTGKDFIIIDFEGEPARSLGERRIKRSPTRDVAGMIRSFDYVTYAALFHQLELGTLQREQLPSLEPWANFWYRHVSAIFLKGYLAVVQPSDLLPKSPEQLRILLDTHLLEKAVYEVGYELNNRPDWLKIPALGILGLLEPGKT